MKSEHDIVRRFFNAYDQLLVWPPAKEKNKLAILAHVSSYFAFEKQYTAEEVNIILQPHLSFPDPGIIRRALHEYSFLQRNRDGSRYWRLNTTLTDDERIQKRRSQAGGFV